ncbi:hypothetical protein BTJ40_10260 [Microbulbifer sp. A4B17]|nr:hypothetical protein BTJ40_10260 [Microbulbifer sp. A4B17]
MKRHHLSGGAFLLKCITISRLNSRDFDNQIFLLNETLHTEPEIVQKNKSAFKLSSFHKEHRWPIKTTNHPYHHSFKTKRNFADHQLNQALNL